MAYFSDAMPAPHPNFDDRDFWNACAEKRLQFQACAECGAARHPPTPVCPHCRSFKVAWRQTAGRAEVYTHTTIHHASHEAVKPNLPYVVGVVTFPDVPGVRLVTNVTGVDPKQVHIGMPVQLWWDAIGDGMQIPRFKPASTLLA
jgi:uncharacterized OB-fold protein